MGISCVATWNTGLQQDGVFGTKAHLERVLESQRDQRLRVENELSARRAAAKARKRSKAKRRKQVKPDGDLDGGAEAEAISGGDAVLAYKCESFSGDGTGPTFFGGDANVGGDSAVVSGSLRRRPRAS